MRTSALGNGTYPAHVTRSLRSSRGRVFFCKELPEFINRSDHQLLIGRCFFEDCFKFVQWTLHETIEVVPPYRGVRQRLEQPSAGLSSVIQIWRCPSGSGC
jgi:hypothetical protein